MGLNIKRETTQELARAVAAMTGQSMTSAIETALAERLERLHQDEDEVSRRLRSIEAIAQDSADRWPAGARGGDLASALYDEAGLPA